MTYDTFRLIFVGGAVGAGVMLVTSVLLFVFLQIPAVIGYLTGHTARKAIEGMQNGSADGMTSGGIRRRNVALRQEKVKTTAEVQRYAGTPGNPVKDTTDLGPDAAADSGDGAYAPVAGTIDLRAEGSAPDPDVTGSPGYGAAGDDSFRIEFEITYIHTDEIIV